MCDVHFILNDAHIVSEKFCTHLLFSLHLFHRRSHRWTRSVRCIFPPLNKCNPLYRYRDSKLTRLLQDSLGGNCLTSVLGCISGASMHSEESLSTLRFVERAKKMKNSPRVNQDPRNALIEENARLKERVRQLEAEVE